jgi:mRNA interferase MazF
VSTDMLDAPLFRLTAEPSSSNGLQHISQIMIDKIVTIPRDTIGSRIGALEHELMVRVDSSLAVFLGIV